VALSTTIARWSLLRSWVLILNVKKLASELHVLSTTLPNMSIPDAHFPALSSTMIRSRFQVKPATLLISIDLFFFFGGGFYGTRYQIGSFSLIDVGSGFHCPRIFSLF